MCECGYGRSVRLRGVLALTPWLLLCGYEGGRVYVFACMCLESVFVYQFACVNVGMDVLYD